MKTLHILKLLFPFTLSIIVADALSQNDIPILSDLNALQSHPNLNLLNGKKCGKKNVNRILGGVEAKPGEFPWMALLQYKDELEDKLEFKSAGSLISPFYILTAGHCVDRNLVSARLGEFDTSTEQDCDFDNVCQDPVQDIPVEKSIVHVKFNKKKNINDIALLRLKTAADVSKLNVKTICLPTTEESRLEHVEKSFKEHMEISGWGRTGTGKKSNILIKAFVPFVPGPDCSQRFAETKLEIHDTYLCAGGLNRTDTCRGDSGGPIIAAGTIKEKTKLILYGVVSSGVDCLNPHADYPGIYTKVEYYMDWILDNMTQ